MQRYSENPLNIYDINLDVQHSMLLVMGWAESFITYETFGSAEFCFVPDPDCEVCIFKHIYTEVASFST